MKESAIQRAILDYLAARHILAFRMNSGALRNPAGKPVAFGVPGMADLVAFPKGDFDGKEISYILWLEIKAVKGKQSELQKSFQKQVEDAGHIYAVVRSIEDVKAALRWYNQS